MIICYKLYVSSIFTSSGVGWVGWDCFTDTQHEVQNQKKKLSKAEQDNQTQKT